MNIHRESDTALASFYVLRGARLEGCEMENARWVRFVLSGLDQWESVRQEFFSGSTRLDLPAFVFTYKRLTYAAKMQLRAAIQSPTPWTSQMRSGNTENVPAGWR